MSSYRIVNIHGEMPRFEAGVIRRFLSNEEYKPFPLECLAMTEDPGCIGQWVSEDGSIETVGLLSIPDVALDDIEMALMILSARFPALHLTMHVSDENAKNICVATFHVYRGGVFRCFPETLAMEGASEYPGLRSTVERIPIVNSIIYPGVTLLLGANMNSLIGFSLQIADAVADGATFLGSPAEKGTPVFFGLSPDVFRDVQNRQYARPDASWMPLVGCPVGYQNVEKLLDEFLSVHPDTKLVIVCPAYPELFDDDRGLADTEIIAELTAFAKARGLCLLVTAEIENKYRTDCCSYSGWANGIIGAADDHIFFFADKSNLNKARLLFSAGDGPELGCDILRKTESSPWQLRNSQKV